MKRAGTRRYTSYTGTNSASSPPETGSYRWMRDVTTPRFQSRSGAGEIIMSPMNSLTQDRTTWVISNYLGWYNNNPNQWDKEEGDYADTYLQLSNSASRMAENRYDGFSQADANTLETEASTKCLSKIGRASTDSWENLAEVGKTVDMLRHPLGSWFAFERKARLATAGLSAANAWLAYRYGVRPLVSSVDDILTALKRSVRKERVTSRGEATATFSTNTSHSWTVSGWWTYVYRKQKTVTWNARAVSVDEVIHDIYSDLGFDVKSMLTLPWNLVPYSFVADWAFNISDFIGALANGLSDVKNRGTCITTRTVMSETRESTDMIKLGPTTPVQKALHGARTDTVWVSRRNGLMTPGIVVKSNLLGGDPITRVADAFALVGQQLLSRFR